MNGYIIHNSVDEEYRRPLGAISTGGKVKLSLYIHDFTRCRVKLIVRSESGGYELEMHNENEFFYAQISAPNQPQVLWYCFFIERDENIFFYGSKKDVCCGVGELYRENPNYFQLTVCEKNFTTPDFFKGCVMYQIFPDRFCSSGENIVKGYDTHIKNGWKTFLHTNFNEKADYLPKQGESYYEPNDFFGGDFKGIEEKLNYISSLGVSVIYLNPIFSSSSNHRYNTADYKTIDAFLGDEEAFKRLCKKAEKLGIRVILDGVFSHTGNESVYFQDALMGSTSPYYSWYTFHHFPDDYQCWWGFKSLPEVDEHDASWQDYIIQSDESVIKYWLRRGASGYRLDVADELPDDVIFLMRDAVKSINNDNLLLGEVWEDATTKQSYGKNRKYALGEGLDSVMNYPIRKAILSFLKGRTNAYELKYFLLGQQQNYASQMYYCLMNLISSHDVERMRTMLALEVDPSGLSREEQAHIAVSIEQDNKAAKLLKLAFSICMAVPGMPSIYYGDECGMHGLKDPFNRETFQVTDEDMMRYYKKWGEIRKLVSLKTGFAAFHNIDKHVIVIFRFTANGYDAFHKECADEAALVFINRSEKKIRCCVDLHSFKFGISLENRMYLENANYEEAVSLFSGEKYKIRDGLLDIQIDAMMSDCLFMKNG